MSDKRHKSHLTPQFFRLPFLKEQEKKRKEKKNGYKIAPCRNMPSSRALGARSKTDFCSRSYRREYKNINKTPAIKKIPKLYILINRFLDRGSKNFVYDVHEAYRYSLEDIPKVV